MDSRFALRRSPCPVCKEPVDAESVPGRGRMRYWTPDSDFIHVCTLVPGAYELPEFWWEPAEEPPPQVQEPAPPRPLLLTEYGDEPL